MLAAARRRCGDRIYWTMDGATHASQVFCNSQTCPMCMRTAARYRGDPSGRTVPADRYGTVVQEIHGIGFLNPFDLSSSIFHGLAGLMPTWAVVWGPLHCSAIIMSYFIEGVSELCADVAGWDWLAAVASVSGFRRGVLGRGANLSMEEVRLMFRAWDQGLFPPAMPHAALNRYLELFMASYREWTQCGSPYIFHALCTALRETHVGLFDSMQPGIHNWVDHLPAQWLASNDPHFPANVSEEVGEKSHKAFKQAWISSLQTTLQAPQRPAAAAVAAPRPAPPPAGPAAAAADDSDADVGGRECGIDEVFRTSWTKWTLPWFPAHWCPSDPAYIAPIAPIVPV